MELESSEQLHIYNSIDGPGYEVVVKNTEGKTANTKLLSMSAALRRCVEIRWQNNIQDSFGQDRSMPAL